MHEPKWKKPDERLHIVWFHLYEISRKVKLQRQKDDPQLPGAESRNWLQINTRELSEWWKRSEPWIVAMVAQVL